MDIYRRNNEKQPSANLQTNNSLHGRTKSMDKT